MANVVVIKFQTGCKSYYFDGNGLELKRGDAVIVETARGQEYAHVLLAEKEVEESKLVLPLKKVLRLASEEDEAVVRRNAERREEAMRICKEKISAHELAMKLVDCELSLDGKVVFFFTAEERVDFRDLVKDLASVFHQRIELRQVGARDETRLLGGIAPCGRECCCAGCMPEFQKVSIKMAKNQGLSLNPGKISGLCGRLMCCLAYENEYYAEAYKKMPKIGAFVSTSEGKGSVIAVNMLKMQVKVKIEKDGALLFRDVPVEDVVVKKGGETEEEEKEAVQEHRPPRGEERERRPKGERPKVQGERTERPANPASEGRVQTERNDRQGGRQGGQGGKKRPHRNQHGGKGQAKPLPEKNS